MDVKTYARADVEALAKRHSAAKKRPRTTSIEEPRPTNTKAPQKPMPSPCPICLEDMASSATTLECGHRLHAACLKEMTASSWAEGTASKRTRRGTQLSCPMCRATTRVRDSTAFRVGETVDARWGGRYYAGTVDEVILDEAGEVEAYEVYWTGGSSNRSRASLVRAAVPGTPLG